MGKKIVRAIAFCFCLFAVLGMFQNCGRFEANVGLSGTSLSSNGIDFSNGLPVGLKAAGRAYERDPYTDSGQTTAVFDADFTNFTDLVSFENLLDLPHLSNGVVDLGQDDQFPDLIPGPKGQLVYAPNQPQFQHVNAYYHLNKFISDIVAAKQFVPPQTPLKVNPHCTAGEFAVNNAYFSPDENLLCMGYANPGGLQVWSADDADVLVHEFGHYLNHKYSTDAIMASTWETGAMDEGLADVWAYRQSGSPIISQWYGRAIFAAFNVPITNYAGLRNLTAVPVYPTDLAAEVHDDSTYISTLLYNIKENYPAITKESLAFITKRILESLQMGDGFGAAIRTLRTESAKVGVQSAYLDGLLTDRGLLRRDDLTSVAVEGVPVIMDNHAFQGFTAGGNCNGVLDAGESVVVFVNLRNSGATDVGQIYAKLTANTATTTVVPGGEVASIYRLLSNQSYLEEEILTQQRLSQNYVNRLLFASFVVKAAPNATGPHTFTVQLNGMNSIDSTPNRKTVTFTLNVGNTPTRAQNCPGNQEQSVFP